MEEACDMLEKHGQEAKLLAGGQSLVLLMKMGLVNPKLVIDIKRIPGLSDIRVEDDASDGKRVTVGALATHAQVHSSPLLRAWAPVLVEATGSIGHPQIRNRGTLGGSLSHSDPAANLGAAVLALKAKMVAVSSGGRRRAIEAESFFRGPFSTALQETEILEKVQFAAQGRMVGYSFKKFALTHGDFPVATACAMISTEEGRCAEAVIAVGGVAEKPFRARQTEDFLKGEGKTDDATIARASELIVRESESGGMPVSEFKRKILKAMARRALTTAVDRAEGARDAI